MSPPMVGGGCCHLQELAVESHVPDSAPSPRVPGPGVRELDFTGHLTMASLIFLLRLYTPDWPTEEFASIVKIGMI